MKKLLTLVVLLMTTISFGQTIITEWNFDTSTTTPSIGSGTIILIGGVLENLQTGTAACNCSFVGGNPSTGKAYTTKNYPAQSTASGTAGIQFFVNTTGQSDINIYVDVYGSNTASKYVQLQYTLDGTTWITVGSPTLVPYTSSSQWTTITTSIPSSSSNFSFRVVSVFDPAPPSPGIANTVYSPVNSGNNTAGTPYTYVNTTGALRFDNVKVSNGVLSTNQNQISGLQFYPNPAKNILNIITDLNSTKNVEIYDMVGKKVLVENTQSQLNVSSLVTGMYIVKITEDGKTSTKRISIN